jgi:hypothetical protein
MKNTDKNVEITSLKVEIPSIIDEYTAAELLCISHQTLRKKLRPKIAHLRVGTAIRYTLEDLKAFLIECRVEAKS